ncbi:MAG: hypothetical protein U9N84_11755 [Actinomycetota bacterium]|nr:hypothetical protein [Actinomycetota bacterium]
MGHDYQRMGTEERTLHHDELRTDGYEWCPECGETLIWDLPAPCKQQSAGGVPVVAGDYPPLTREELAITSPPTDS